MIGKNMMLVIVSLLICFSSISADFINTGFHGNTWMKKEADNVTYVLKEPKFGLGRDNLNVRREKYFGKKLSTAKSTAGKDNVARYIKHVKEGKKIQLVFMYEGAQLEKLIFQFDGEEKMFKPTAWLNWLRKTTEGQQVMKNLFHQMLLGVKFCHDNGVIHRDIKPANMVICFEKTKGSCGMVTPMHTNDVHLRIIDFGSAVNRFAIRNLYGEKGPAWEEQDMYRMPPEAIIDPSWSIYSLTPKYDSWCVGHIMLEFILGTPQVFSAEDFSSAEMVRNYDPDDEIDYPTSSLAGMAEHCIGLPEAVHIEKMIMLPTCTDDGYADFIRNRSSLPRRFIDIELLNLVRLLLEADPDLRVGVDEALRHPYFTDSTDFADFTDSADSTNSTDISLYWYAIVLALVLIPCICCYGAKRKTKKKAKE